MLSGMKAFGCQNFHLGLKIGLEESFPKNPNKTYFACVKAKIIASEVDTAKKEKTDFF